MTVRPTETFLTPASLWSGAIFWNKNHSFPHLSLTSYAARDNDVFSSRVSVTFMLNKIALSWGQLLLICGVWDLLFLFKELSCLRRLWLVGGESVGWLPPSCWGRAYAHWAEFHACPVNNMCTVQGSQVQLFYFYSLLFVASNLFPSFSSSHRQPLNIAWFLWEHTLA